MGETEVALMTPRETGEYRRVLTSHLQELRDLADAVDNLVTICSQRKGHDNVTQTRESFDLAPEAKLRLARESGYASACGVELKLDSKGDTRLYGDREGLLRAMRNLTANAIEWSTPGTQVDVHLSGENGRVVVTVDDSGPGVPDELKQRIFEPFFRGPQAKGRRIGYGLGLAIVRAAVDAQGGEVVVSRSPNGGARFCMFLPRNLKLPAIDDTQS
jgi:signal transduction histidine kinase